MKLIKRLGKVMNAMVLIDSTQCRSVLRPSVLLTIFDLLVTQERCHRLKIVEESESILDGVVHMALDWLSSHATCAANIVLPLRANPMHTTSLVYVPSPANDSTAFRYYQHSYEVDILHFPEKRLINRFLDFCPFICRGELRVTS